MLSDTEIALLIIESLKKNIKDETISKSLIDDYRRIIDPDSYQKKSLDYGSYLNAFLDPVLCGASIPLMSAVLGLLFFSCLMNNASGTGPHVPLTDSKLISLFYKLIGLGGTTLIPVLVISAIPVGACIGSAVGVVGVTVKATNDRQELAEDSQNINAGLATIFKSCMDEALKAKAFIKLLAITPYQANDHINRVISIFVKQKSEIMTAFKSMIESCESDNEKIAWLTVSNKSNNLFRAIISYQQTNLGYYLFYKTNSMIAMEKMYDDLIQKYSIAKNIAIPIVEKPKENDLIAVKNNDGVSLEASLNDDSTQLSAEFWKDPAKINSFIKLLAASPVVEFNKLKLLATHKDKIYEYFEILINHEQDIDIKTKLVLAALNKSTALNQIFDYQRNISGSFWSSIKESETTTVTKVRRLAAQLPLAHLYNQTSNDPPFRNNVKP